jgi:muramidase (phage lysozyme)
MPIESQDRDAVSQSETPVSQEPGSFANLFLSICFLLITGLALRELYQVRWERSPTDPSWGETPAPLVMEGGDPYIRALMRTISSSEANDPRPYSMLYGGEHINDLSRHPDICIPIVAGPNVGDCTTAAGRYQFLSNTWEAKAEQYHPERHQSWFWNHTYSFAPEHQDQVVYAWLSDPTAWGADISQMLRQGRLQDVLWLLSSTWTSLGYGIEDNVMTSHLPEIYQEMLQEELNRTF